MNLNVRPIDVLLATSSQYSPIAAAMRAATHPVTLGSGSAAMFAGAGLRMQTPDVIVDIPQQALAAEAAARTRDTSQAVPATAAAYRPLPFLRQYRLGDLSNR